jgi:hypothetical protein
VSGAEQPVPFASLDFVYLPSADVARDLGFYRDVLGGQILFAIERFGTRVAEVRLAPDAPRFLLAQHLAEGEAPVFIHRVGDLDRAKAELAERGLEVEATFEIPPGNCATLRTPGGQRIGIYEETRPEVYERLEARLDFEPESA